LIALADILINFCISDGSIDLCFNVIDILKLHDGKEIESGIRVNKRRQE
jgi:hypothetical protein